MGWIILGSNPGGGELFPFSETSRQGMGPINPLILLETAFILSFD